MRIGLLGGTFDPVHIGHIKLASAALTQLKLERVYLVLAPRPPHKLTRVVAPVSDRLQMLRCAIRGEKKLQVATWELKRKGPSFTVTTLRNLKRIHPNDQLFFIMGSDTFSDFEHWKDPEEILSLTKLAIGVRPGSTRINVKPEWRRSVVRLKGEFPDYSSREVRRNLEDGKLLVQFVTEGVAEYILRTGLYRHEQPR